jgi:endonuclease-3
MTFCPHLQVGFWRRKTEYLRAAAAILRDKFDGDVPKTVDELCSLPGVGPKMAFLVLQVGILSCMLINGN